MFSLFPATSVLISIAIIAPTMAGRAESVRPSGNQATSGALRNLADVEIRFEFYPGNTPNFDDSTVPFFIAIGRDGRARALRYMLRFQTNMCPVKAYEGSLPESEVQSLFAQVEAAFRLPRHRAGYDRRLIYESDSFYLALKREAARVKEMSGGLETRPDEVRALSAHMREIWKQLKEVPPPYAYLTSRPIEKERLKRLGHEYKVKLTPIESLPVALQALLIPVVTGPRNFYPLTKAQYELFQTYQRPLIYKGTGYEPWVILTAKEAEPIQPRKE